jgi:hypothetical protein
MKEKASVLVDTALILQLKMPLQKYFQVSVSIYNPLSPCPRYAVCSAQKNASNLPEIRDASQPISQK